MRIPALLIALVWFTTAGAGTAPPLDFDAASLPTAFGPPAADTATAAETVGRRLPSAMSVVTGDALVLAIPGSPETAAREVERIASLDAALRHQVFPSLERRPLVVIVAADSTALRDLARSLYPAIAGREIPAGGFYHPVDRLILTGASAGDTALLRELTRAHLRDDNPKAPYWFEQALVTLYESAKVREHRLVPVLDGRMEQIPSNEDLGYDVFAGICDCSPVSAEQLALMRLLLVYLDDRGRVPELLASVAALGQYTTLLQALERMDLDGAEWKAYAEHSVRDHSE